MAEKDSEGAPAEEIVLNSTLESVDRAELMVLQAAREVGVPEDDLQPLGIAVRETMVNAVVHGNRYNARKKVRLSLAKQSDRLTVVVRDEGNGFAPESLPDPLAEENLLRQSGRGLLMIRAFVDEFHVRPIQPNGTEVVLVKYVRGKSQQSS